MFGAKKGMKNYSGIIHEMGMQFLSNQDFTGWDSAVLGLLMFCFFLCCKVAIEPTKSRRLEKKHPWDQRPPHIDMSMCIACARQVQVWCIMAWCGKRKCPSMSKIHESKSWRIGFGHHADGDPSSTNCKYESGNPLFWVGVLVQSMIACNYITSWSTLCIISQQWHLANHTVTE